MAAGLHLRIGGWIYHHLLWDTAGTSRPSSTRRRFARAVWATRKLLLAVAISAVLDWAEWTEHHPPDMGFIVVAHFLFVFAFIAIVVYVRGLFGRTEASSTRG